MNDRGSAWYNFFIIDLVNLDAFPNKTFVCLIQIYNTYPVNESGVKCIVKKYDHKIIVKTMIIISTKIVH